MTRSDRRTPTLGAIALALIALAMLAGGCSDFVTFSGEHRAHGIKAYNDGQMADAAGAFRAAIKEDPRDYQSRYYLGMAYLNLGNYQQAIVEFRSCLSTRNVTLPGQEDTATAFKALDGLAQAIHKADSNDLEVNKVEQAARNSKGPEAAQEYFILAKVYRLRGLPDMALDYYNRACISDNANFNYLKEYGLYCEQLQQQARAEQALRQAYALNTRDGDVNSALSRLGVVVGPSLKNKEDLTKPLLPRGPLPEVDWSKVGLGGGEGNGAGAAAPGAAAPAATPARTGNNTAAMPRD